MFEWDEVKAVHNSSKHGVSFDEATQVFADPTALDGFDLLHSTFDETRYLRIGQDLAGTVITLAYTIRGSNEKKIRIISARKASKKEKKAYKR